MNKKQKGFSLIELLIVVAIILIIAAIAIPNLLRSRMAANEASAVGSIRTINTASVTFNTTYGDGFPADSRYDGRHRSRKLHQRRVCWIPFSDRTGFQERLHLHMGSRRDESCGGQRPGRMHGGLH